MSERPTTGGNGAPAEAIEPIRSGTLRPTIRDVARAASVSVGTVSKALNNNGSLRQETRERVIAAAKALGFRPNDATDDSEREAQHVESPALVTGANKGIGHEVARQLGSMGFHVLVGARRQRLGIHQPPLGAEALAKKTGRRSPGEGGSSLNPLGAEALAKETSTESNSYSATAALVRSARRSPPSHTQRPHHPF
jgi:hypothetical protein